MVLYEDLRSIVLLGFSYGGMVVTGSLEHIADRVRHLVYLDAFVPDDGETLNGMSGRHASPITLGEQWLVPPFPRDFDDADEAAFAIARRTPHPARCFSEPVHLGRPLEQFPFTRTFIRATADAADAPGADVFSAAAARAQSSPAWGYREIATTHMVASNRPRDLAEILLDLD